MIATKHTQGTVYASENCVDIFPKFAYSTSMSSIVYSHGANETALVWTDTTKGLAGEVLKYSSRYPSISGDNGGTATWGNPTSITRLGGYLGRVQSRAGVSTTNYALIGNSMGGLLSINYAAQATIKPKCMVLQIPVINVEDIRANNRGGLASAVNAAYGGTYSDATNGPNHNPYVMRSAAKLMGIPMLIIYGTNDAICLPSFTTAFAAADPTKRTTIALPYGHETGIYEAIDTSAVQNFLETYLG